MRKDEGPGSSLATAPGLDSPVLTGTLVPVPPAPEVHGLETLHRKGIHAAATSSGSHDLLRVWLRSIAAGVGGEPLSNREEFARELDRGRRRILDLEARHDHLTSQLAGLEAATLPDGTGPAAPRSLEPLKHELAELRIRRETILAASGSSRSRFRFVTESVVLALLTAYLYFFYVNAGHSAFSKNLGEAAAVAAGSGDISLLFHSLFDPGAFLAAVSSGNVLLLLFPFVFVAFAIGFHGALSSPRGGRWKAAGLFLATLAIDVLVAYLITRNSHDIRVLTGLATGSFGPREAALEPRFWIVIFLGIVVAVLWGLLYGSWMSHLSDNGEKEVEARIRGKEAEIADRISEHSSPSFAEDSQP